VRPPGRAPCTVAAPTPTPHGSKSSWQQQIWWRGPKLISFEGTPIWPPVRSTSSAARSGTAQIPLGDEPPPSLGHDSSCGKPSLNVTHHPPHRRNKPTAESLPTERHGADQLAERGQRPRGVARQQESETHTARVEFAPGRPVCRGRRCRRRARWSTKREELQLGVEVVQRRTSRQDERQDRCRNILRSSALSSVRRSAHSGDRVDYRSYGHVESCTGFRRYAEVLAPAAATRTADRPQSARR
jgi:hypothetical protein